MTTSHNTFSGQQKPLLIITGNKYRNLKGDVIHIIRALKPEDADFKAGYHFIDSTGAPYTNTGAFSLSDLPNELDLVEELDPDFIETVETDVRRMVEPGFFTRMVGRVRRHPVRTTIVVGGIGGVGVYGGYNYRDHGSVLPNINLSRQQTDAAVRTAAAFVRRFR